MPHHAAKPVPVRRDGEKKLGWKREPRVGFVVPRLNPSSGFTRAVGFTSDFITYDSDESRKR